MFKKTFIFAMGLSLGLLQGYPDNQSVLRFLEEYGDQEPGVQKVVTQPAAFMLDTTMTKTGALGSPAAQHIGFSEK